MRIEPVSLRFVRKVRFTPTCWEWTGTISRYGYGQTYMDGRRYSAHRLAWWLTHGGRFPAPHLAVCHKCDNRRCVRPDHLFVGTQGDNARDMIAKGRNRNQNMGKTHCHRGHPLGERDVFRNRRGQRTCKICNRGYTQRWRNENPERAREVAKNYRDRIRQQRESA